METFRVVVAVILTLVIVVGLLVPTVLHIVTTLKECKKLREQIEKDKKVKGRNSRPERFENNFENSSRK